MSKKIILGAAIAAAAGIAAGVIYSLIKEDERDTLWDEGDDISTIDLANEFLSEAKTRARELVDYANLKSDELLDEANNILIIAKEKAESLIAQGSSEAGEELQKAKEEIEKLISEYQKKLKD
ncbi:MAG: hypothetical protein K1X85_06650 [Ignavibacteria bacterium]|nr:hypothetical protein [Ignavibacteria bacterium]